MEDGLYLGEELGICDEEAMIQDEMNILRSCMEEDNEPCDTMHASVRTESALMNEAKSADQVQGIWVSQPGGLMCENPRQESKSRNQGIRTAQENPEKAEPMQNVTKSLWKTYAKWKN